MNAKQPDEPKFITNATQVQKWLASIAVSIFFTVWISGWEVIQNIFKPDFIKPLTYLRMSLAFIGITLTALVGYQQIVRMLDWLSKSYEIYKEMLEVKKEKEK